MKGLGIKPENHISSLQFGMNVTDEHRLLDMVLNNLYDVDPEYMKLTCIEIYDRLYGMRDGEEDDLEHPWAVVLHNKKECLHDVLPRDFYFDVFISNDISKLTGLSWLEFKQLDFDEAELTLKKIKDRNERIAKEEYEIQERVRKQYEESNAAASSRNQIRQQRDKFAGARSKRK